MANIMQPSGRDLIAALQRNQKKKKTDESTERLAPEVSSTTTETPRISARERLAALKPTGAGATSPLYDAAYELTHASGKFGKEDPANVTTSRTYWQPKTLTARERLAALRPSAGARAGEATGQSGSGSTGPDYSTYDIDAARERMSQIERTMAGISEHADTYLREHTDNYEEAERVAGRMFNNRPVNLMREEYERLQKEIEGAENWQRYDSNRRNADFAQRSGYDAAVDDDLYRAINGDAEARQRLEPEFNPFGGEYAAYAYANAMEGGYRRETAQMGDDEIALYNYLYATGGRDAAMEYLNYITPELNARQRAEEEGEFRQMASDSPVLSSALAVLAGPLRIGTFGAQAIDLLTSGDVDQNAWWNRRVYGRNAILGQVGQDISQSVYEKATAHGFDDKKAQLAADLGRSGYQLFMSYMDSRFNTMISGGLLPDPEMAETEKKAIESLSLTLMSTGAAADTLVEAKDEGRSPADAFVTSVVAGAAEYVTEIVSLEALLDGDVWDKHGMYLLKNWLAEGSEEMASDVINLVDDIVRHWGRTELDKKAAEYKENDPSLTDGQAYARAIGWKAGQIGLSGLGGGIMGLFGAGTNVMLGQAMTQGNNRDTGKTLRGMDSSIAGSVIEEGLTLDPNSEGYRLAQKLSDRLQSGKKISDADLGRLYNYNVEGVDVNAETDASRTSEGVRNYADGRSALLDAAEETARSGGAISNRAAESLLSDPVSVRALTARAGLSLTEDMTQSERRSAVKDAVAALASARNADDTARTGAGTTERQNAAEREKTPREQAAFVGIGKQGQAAFEAAAEAGVPIGAFDAYWEAGRDGRELGTVRSTLSNQISDNMKKLAWNAGRVDAIESGESVENGTANAYNEDNGAVIRAAVSSAFRNGNTYTADGYTYAVTETAGGYALDIISENGAVTNGGVYETRDAAIDIAAQAAQTINERNGADNGTGETVRLRDGSERNDGTGAGRQVRGLEEGTGRDQGRNAAAGQGAGAEAAGNPAGSLQAGQQVSAADYGIRGGSTRKTVTVVNQIDKKTRAAWQLAKKHGLNVHFFSGGSLIVDGNPVRGLIQGNDVYVRTDHPQFSPYQIMRHELMHNLIDTGKVRLNEVLGAVTKKMGAVEVTRAAQTYASAYTGMTWEEALLEMVCDAYGRMNIFKGLNEFAGEDLTRRFVENARTAIADELRQGRTGEAGGGETQTSREYSGEQVEWAVDSGVLTEQERIAFFHQIANISKLGDKVRRTSDGGYIVDLGNKLLFTDGNWRSPSLSSVVVFDDTYETSMREAKDVIFNAKAGKAGYNEARQTIERAYWPGYVERYTAQNSGTYGRENTGAEGTDRSANNERTRDRVNEGAEAPVVEGSVDQNEAEEAAVHTSRETDPETLDFLENQDHVTVYRAMQLIDGELYPPMAAKVKGEDGKARLVEPTEIGTWYKADERPDLVKDGKFTLNKGNGSSIAAAYNPYFHSSASPLNDQFSSAYKRPNLVVVEGEIPASELTSGYRAEGAKNAVGETSWHSGPVASKLKGDKARRVYLSRWFKVNRIVSDAEAARTIANTLRGEDVAVPTNVVTPSLLEELRKNGVRIEEKEKTHFSMELPVEETKDLVAVHGMTANNLRGALKLGGLPMPSIAVVKANAGHNRYGEISLVFDKSTIDPQADSRNKVYGADAWTPTAPRVDYPVDQRGAAAFEDRIGELSGRIANGAFQTGSILRQAGIDEDTNLTADEMAQKLAQTDAARAAYLADRGETVDPVFRTKEYDQYGNAFVQKIVDQVGAQELAAMMANIHTDGMTEEQLEAVREIWRQNYVETFPAQLKAKRGLDFVESRSRTRADDLRDGQIENFVRHAWEFYEDGAVPSDEVDRIATSNAVKERAGEQETIDWLRPQLETLLGEPGIYNGKDPYTSSGNRKSFRQLHDAYTLENIVKAMRTTQAQRGEGVWGISAKGLQATATPSYRSIADIKADSGRLGAVGTEEYNAQVSAVEAELDEIIDEITGADGSFYGREIAGDLLLQAAQGRRTVYAIQSLFQRESALRVSGETAEKILQLYRDAAALPTEYFEAKPQRAVGFDEVLAAVVPSNMDAALKKALEDQGVDVLEYEYGNDADRTEKLNTVEGARFSREVDASYLSAVESGDMRTAQRMVDEAAEAAGYDIDAYHATANDFTVFDRGRLGENTDGNATDAMLAATAHLGHWFNSADVSPQMGVERAMHVKLRIDHPLQMGSLDELVWWIEENAQADNEDAPDVIGRKAVDALVTQGYDGIILDDEEFGGTSYVALDSEQIKSADPVTYDDDGNVIPLSQRFNSEERDIRFSREVDFEKNYDAWAEAGKPSGKHITIGTTPDVLAEAGIEPKRISWDTTKLNEIQKKHPYMTDAVIKQASAMLDAPVLVLTSKTQANRAVFFGEVYVPDPAGNDVPVMAAIELLPTRHGYTLDEYKVASSYAKEQPDTIPNLQKTQDLINSSRFLYIDPDTKRTQNWLDHTGLQLPFASNQFGVIDRISLVPRDVNGNFSFGNTGRELQDWQKKLQSLDFDEESNTSHTSREAENLTELAQQNKDLEKRLRDVTKLAERKTAQADYWRGQTKLTTSPTARAEDIRKAANILIRDYASTIKADAITGQLTELANYMMGDEVSFSEVKDRAAAIASEIVHNAEALVNNGDAEDYRTVKALLNRRMVISQKDAASVSPEWGQWRNANRGKVNVNINGDGLPVDTAYQELSAEYPWLFPEDVTNPADQVLQMVDALESLEPIYENPYSVDMATAIEYAANDIIDTLLSDQVRQTAPTFADRAARKLEDQKAKSAAAIRRVREARDRQVQALKDHYREVREAQTARRADRKARDRLLHIARRLQNRKLPAADRSLINEYIGDLDTISKGITGKTLTDLTALQQWYSEQAENDPDFIRDPATERKLQRLSQRHIKDMTAEEVAELTEVLLNIENELRTEKKIIDSEDRRDTYLMGTESIQDIENSRGNKATGPMAALDKYIVTETLSPLRQLHRMTGYKENSPLYVLTEKLADGQRAMFDYQRRANDPFKAFANDKSFVRDIAGEKAKEITVTGTTKDGPKTVKITPAMRISLYLHSLNDQNLKHIAQGGITVPDMKLYKAGKIADAYARGTTIKLTPSQVRSITANMTTKERAYAEAARKYFNGMSRDSINEVSEKLKGYSLAGVENYFPIDTDTSFTRSDFDAIKFDGTIEGMGFLKERQNAANPIMLRDLTDVLNKSISMHAKYVGLAIPVRNFNKVWGVTSGSYNADGSRNNFESSVQQAVKQKWGETGYKYVEKMMTDLQGGHSDRNVWAQGLSKVRSAYAGAVLTLNASVAMKQAASYPTAGAVVGFKPLARALADVRKVDLDLVAKYTPLLWYRSQGFSTQELGDMTKRGIKLPKVLNWVQGVDVITTQTLWKAAEYYVRDNDRSLAIGTDAYYKAVADVYNRIIEETQPNYTTMQRPQLLRSEDTLMQNLAMFKTQPFQNFNILYDAIGNMEAKKRAVTNATADTRAAALAEYKDARKKAGWAITSQLMQLAVFAGMTFVWNAFRGKLDKYKDEEEDEVTTTSALAGIGKDMLGGAASIVPFGSDVWELASSYIFGDTYYGFDAVTPSAINDAISAFNKAGKALGEIWQGVRDPEAKVNWNEQRIRLDSVADAASKVAGIPYENVINLLNATYRWASIAAGGKYRGEYAALRMTTSPSAHAADYYDLLWKAYNNDQDAYEDIYQSMIESGDLSPEKIKNAMEKKMKAAQGVEKVSELDARYLTPDQQARYDESISQVENSKLWKSASDDQRAKAADMLYAIATGSNEGQRLQEKIDGGAAYGLTESEYILYKVALSMADKPTDSGKYGTYTNDEVEAAIRMLTGLSGNEKDYLWTAQGKNAKSIPNW